MTDNRLRDAERLYKTEPTVATYSKLITEKLRAGIPIAPDIDLADYDALFSESASYRSSTNTLQSLDGAIARDVSIAEVACILAGVPGMNDESNWLILVALKDGTFAYLEGGCDYSGWG